MQEKLVIVPKKTTGGHKAGMIAFFVLTCLCLVLSMFVSPVMFLVPTIIFGVIWYLFAFRSEVEYEYTYYDGDLRFAKIRNKAKRKKIAYLSMDDVLTIAPKALGRAEHFAVFTVHLLALLLRAVDREADKEDLPFGLEGGVTGAELGDGIGFIGEVATR